MSVNRDGFTLIEILVSIVLLGIVSAAVANLLFAQLRATSELEKRTKTVSEVMLARSIVERSAPLLCSSVSLSSGPAAGRIPPSVSVVAVELVAGSPAVCLFTVTAGSFVLEGAAEMSAP